MAVIETAFALAIVLVIVILFITAMTLALWRGGNNDPPPEKSTSGGDEGMFHEVLIEADDLTIGRQIGKGAFGVVHEGVHQGKKVAIKVMKGSVKEEDKKKFLEEASLMKDFDHPNVLPLLGVYFQPPMIIVPYMANGDLETKLHKHNLHLNPDAEPLGCQQLLNFSIQVIDGMAYLASVNIVHRDLAARNCLLSENMVVKVADFGLARNMQDDKIYRMKSDLPLPIKSMAPESLKHYTWTTESDVWSYGVLLWEIMSLGACLYPGIGMGTILAYLGSGQRLSKPSGCPDSVYNVMLACWHSNPRQRPSFTELKRMLAPRTASPGSGVTSPRHPFPDFPCGFTGFLG